MNMKKIAITMCLLMCLSLVACNEPSAQKPVNSEPVETNSPIILEDTESMSKKVGLVQVGSTNVAFIATQTAVEEKCASYGWECIVNEPQVYKDQQSQIEAVEQLLVQDIDALIIQPVDTNGANDVIQRACDMGIAVITLDTKVSTEDVVTHIASDHENDGYVCAKALFDAMGGKGEVIDVILTNVDGAGKGRETGFRKALEEYPNIVCVASINAEKDAVKAVDGFQDALNAFPDVEGVFVAWGGAGLGVYNACVAAGKEDVVWQVCVDVQDEQLQLVYDGAVNFVQ